MHRLKTRLPLQAIAAGSLILLSVAACRKTSGKDNATLNATTSSPAGIPASPVGSHDTTGMTPKLKGKQAPGFTLTGLDGRKISLSSLRGQPVVLNFWATWCGPCKVEMPWFEEFGKKYANRGLIVIGVANDDASQAEIAKIVKRAAVTYPILIGDRKVVNEYGGLEYVPETFYIDRRGNVAIETAGATAGDAGKAEIERNIETLLADARN